MSYFIHHVCVVMVPVNGMIEIMSTQRVITHQTPSKHMLLM